MADVVARPAQRDGGEPPDVIDVPFPAPRRGRPDRPLLLCSLALAGVALAAALAWQRWPQPRPAAAARLGAPPVTPGLAPPAQGRTGKQAPTPAPTRLPAPRATAHPAGGPRVLRAGSRGPDVTDLQRLLFDQGFTYVSQTSVFDAATVRGVRQLQSDRGLICDPPGVYGICTRAALTS